MQAKMHNFSTWVKEVSPRQLKAYYYELLIQSGFNVLQVAEHHFNPHGYTALFLLSESHFAIHTFPEQGTSYIELSSCVEKQFLKFINLLRP